MQPLCHLSIRFFELLDDLGLRRRRVRCRADIVDPFKDDRVLDPGLGEDVPIDSGQGVGTESVGEDPVPTGSLVENGEGEVGLLKTGGKVVGPPAIKSGWTVRMISWLGTAAKPFALTDCSRWYHFLDRR